MLPAAGIVGVVAHPFQGAWKALQSSTGQKEQQQQRVTRISDGKEAVKNSTGSQRAAILKKFKEGKPGTKERQRKCKEAAEKVMLEEAEESRKDMDNAKKESTSDGSSSSSSSSPLPPQTAANQDERTSVIDEDVAFERDLEFAKQLSLAEQHGYERGLASQWQQGV